MDRKHRFVDVPPGAFSENRGKTTDRGAITLARVKQSLAVVSQVCHSLFALARPVHDHTKLAYLGWVLKLQHLSSIF